MNARLPERDVLPLIDAAYAAAQEPRLWDGFLERLADSTHGSMASLISQDRRTGQARVVSAIRIPPEAIRRYEECQAWQKARALAAEPELAAVRVLRVRHRLPTRT